MMNPSRSLTLRSTEDGLDSGYSHSSVESLINFPVGESRTDVTAPNYSPMLSSEAFIVYSPPSKGFNIPVDTRIRFRTSTKLQASSTADMVISSVVSNIKSFSYIAVENNNPQSIPTVSQPKINNISLNAVKTMLKSVSLPTSVKTTSATYVQPSHAFKPEIPNSRLVTQKSDFIPTGPVTGWVPVFYPSHLNPRPIQVDNAERGKEPTVITEQTKFYFTVTHFTGRSGISKEREQVDSIVQNDHVGSYSKIEKKNTSDGDFYNLSSELSVEQSDVELTYTKPRESVLETIQSASPEDLSPTKNRNDEKVITLFGSGTLSDDVTTKQTTTTRSSFPTGRPYVVPVDIEDVRPFIGSGPPGGLTGNNNTPQFPGGQNFQARPGVKPPLRRAPFKPRPPIIRIDTCIIGDDSTCDVNLNEWCKTEVGISACHCRPGYARTASRGPCTPVISLLLAMKADRLDNKKLKFNQLYQNPNSEEFQLLEYEAEHALSSLFPYTALAKDFLGVKVNTFYSIGGIFMVNATVKLKETTTTKKTSVKQQLKNELNKVINQNIGDSRLQVQESPSPVPLVEDFDECADPDTNDCSKNGYCVNELGSFWCHCKPGYLDKFQNDRWKAGRQCYACSSEFCNNHGECVVSKETTACKCRDNYMGTHCDIDREVLGVALGASITAAVIIILTLICLCVWNRRSNKNDKKMGTSPSARIGQIYNYVNENSTPRRSSRLSVEDRMRWHHLADAVGRIYEPHLADKQVTTSVPPIQQHVYAAPSRVHSPILDDNHHSQPQRPRSRASYLSELSGPYHSVNQTSIEEYNSNVNQGYLFRKSRSYHS
ncbi:uncharacterized protein LOC111086895 [Limulus polyphemus]|uniref:protein disulfide-isomerase n=1 Tax=Limulus polyphemus TaxID=6850 RepID=A0ABM1SUK1_LIMPO|nr:uncharacterized protein LOC111086895 [Limulus polyphemus]